MAKVTLYFMPYSEDDANGLRIEESPDGIGSWVTIEDVGVPDIGTFPEYISSYTTDNATSTDSWFRIAWLVSGAPQGFSEPVQVGDLPPRYITSDILQEMTMYPAIQAASDIYLNRLIDTAYFMFQDHCGPFDETNPMFIERSPIAMLMMVEWLFLRLDPTLAAATIGIVEEKIGSYSYKLANNAGETIATLVPPNHIVGLLCPFGINDETATELITQSVFLQGAYTVADDEVDSHGVFVEGDADFTAPVTHVWPRRWSPD